MESLPDDVVHRIIIHHLLGDPETTNKTALQFGLLSKDFWRAVHSRPAFLFEDKNHHHHDINCKCLKELKYMISALEQNTHLENFTFRCLYQCTANDRSNFDRCIELAAANSRGLKNFNLCMWGYVLPQAVFQVKSLVQLDLMGCHLPPFGSNMITWPNLKRLHLSYVKVGDGIFENIDTACPSIEILEIISCSFNTKAFHIKVPNLSYLRQLVIKLNLNSFETVEVDANVQNLECLECNRPFQHVANVLQNLECLECNRPFQHVDNFGDYEYHKLRSLSVYRPELFSHDFFTNMEHRFPRLEELSIINVHHSITRINISSSSLKKIILNNIGGLKEIILDVPNILMFEYKGFTNVPNLSFAGNAGGWISHIHFNGETRKIKQPFWIKKVKEFLAALESPVTSIQVCCQNHGMITHGFDIETHPFPECVVKQLNICSKGFIGNSFDLQSLAIGILPDIFSIFRPQRITLTDWPECEFPKLLYDNLMGYDLKFQNLMLSVTEIHMPNVTEISVLKQPKLMDRENFLKLVRCSHLKKAPITIAFEMNS